MEKESPATNKENNPSVWDSLSEYSKSKSESESVSDRRSQKRGRKILGILKKNEISPTIEYEYNQKKMRQNLTAQEKIERALNDTFYSIEELESMMKNGAEGSSFRIVEYDGKKIPIYYTGNLPIRFLYHSIQYSGGDKTQPLVDNPALWDKDEKQAMDLMKTSFSNMLSLEYIDSIQYRMLEQYERTDGIGYGFLHLPAKSLSTITTQGQQLRKQRDDIYFSSHETPEQIASRYFSELQTFRYDEDSGKPTFRPDFILAPSKKGITEDVIRQAMYFGVPIFEIPTKEIKSQEKKTEDEDAEAEKLIDGYLLEYSRKSWQEEKSLPSMEKLFDMGQTLHYYFYEADKNDERQMGWKSSYPELYERKVLREYIQSALEQKRARTGESPDEEKISETKQRLYHLMSTPDRGEWSRYEKRLYPELWEYYKSKQDTKK